MRKRTKNQRKKQNKEILFLGIAGLAILFVMSFVLFTLCDYVTEKRMIGYADYEQMQDTNSGQSDDEKKIVATITYRATEPIESEKAVLEETVEEETVEEGAESGESADSGEGNETNQETDANEGAGTNEETTPEEGVDSGEATGTSEGVTPEEGVNTGESTATDEGTTPDESANSNEGNNTDENVTSNEGTALHEDENDSGEGLPSDEDTYTQTLGEVSYNEAITLYTDTPDMNSELPDTAAMGESSAESGTRSSDNLNNENGSANKEDETNQESITDESKTTESTDRLEEKNVETTDGTTGETTDETTGGTTDETTDGTTDETTGDTISEEKEYVVECTSLAEAFEKAQAVYELVNQGKEAQEAEFPVIKLCADINLDNILINQNPYGFVLDFNGWFIRFTNNSYFYNSTESVIRFTDNSYVTENEAETQRQPGGIAGTYEYLITGNSDAESANGMYIFEQGIFISKYGSIVKRASAIQVLDGFYVFSEVLGFAQEGNLSLKEGTVLFPCNKTVHERSYAFETVNQDGTDTQVEVCFANEVEYKGFVLDSPDYKVTLYQLSGELLGQSMENGETYYATLQNAWADAQKITQEANRNLLAYSVSDYQITAVITILDSSITSLVVEQPLCMEQGNIYLENFRVHRANDYTGNLLTVKGGTLTIKDTVFDGTIYSDNVYYADSALVTLEGGTVYLIGTGSMDAYENQKGVILTNNRQKLTDSTEENGNRLSGGLYLGKDMIVYMKGYLDISNNFMIQQTAEGNLSEIPCNLHMSNTGKIALNGKINLFGEKKIGITLEEKPIAGLSEFGFIDSSYQSLFEQEKKEEAVEDNDLYSEIIVSTFDERLNMFVLEDDNYSEFFLAYNPNLNKMYWDCDTRILPEAGVLRMEFTFVILGFYLLLIRWICIRRKRTTVEKKLLVGAFALIIVGACTYLYHTIQERVISNENMQVIQEMLANQEAEYSITKLEKEETVTESLSSEIEETEEPVETVDTDEEKMPEELVLPDDGRAYFGIVEIPSLQLKLPVLENYSDTNMKTTPCIYHGSTEAGNLVIVGHNYQTQFGVLNSLEDTEELEVILTKMDGTVYHYQSIFTEEMNPSEVDRMIEGEWDMTLFTCNFAMDKRIAVRFTLLQE